MKAIKEMLEWYKKYQKARKLRILKNEADYMIRLCDYTSSEGALCLAIKVEGVVVRIVEDGTKGIENALNQIYTMRQEYINKKTQA